MLLSWIAGVASAVSLVMQLDSNEVVAGQSVGLTLQAIDAQMKVRPTIPVPEGVRVEFVQQVSGWIVIDMQRVRTTNFRYEVTPLQAGEYSIGPVSVLSNTGSVVAPAVKLSVTPRAESAAEVLVADLSVPVAYVGQTVVYHLKYQTASRLLSGRWAPPDVDGLMVEPGVEPVTTDYRVGDGGKAVSVQEMWYPWRATKPGKLSIPAGVLLAQFAVQRRRNLPGFDDPFFGDLPGSADVRSDNIVSGRLDLEVRPLPTEGKPASFSGLVGQFELSQRVSATEAAVGETVSVDVVLSGNGPLAGFALPDWSGAGYRVYDDSPTTELRLSDGNLAAKTHFKRAVVPETPGELALPAISVSWFDPVLGQYVERQTDPITLRVGGSASAASIEGFGRTVDPRSSVETLGDDILPVRTEARISSPWPGHFAWLALVPGSLMLVGQAAPLLRRRRVPVVETRLRFEDLPTEPEARLSGLETIFRDEASSRLAKPAPELVREDVAALGEEALALYKELDLARYRGGVDPPEARLKAWLERT